MIKNIKSQIKELLNYKARKKIKKQIKTLIALMIIFIITLFIISIFFSSKFFQKRTYQPAILKEAEYFQGEIFFNNRKEDEIFEKIIAKSIESAQKSIDIAMYSFNVFALKRDLYRAHERGVEINIILSKNKIQQHQIVFEDLPKGINISYVGSAEDDNFSQYMHHKFIIIDKNTEQAKLITGSVNFTEYQLLFDPSYLLITADSNIIEAYTKEFTRLQNNYSGPDKLRLANYRPWAERINYQDSFLDIYFSPGFKENNINSKITELIQSAEKEIKIMAWQASDMNIAKNIIVQARKGLEIKIIVDDANFADQFSIFPHLLKAKKQYQLENLEIVTDTWKSLDLYNEIPNELVGDNFFNSFFHHHALLVDNNLVLFGTNNWSNMGSNINDENTMISDNKYLVNRFNDVFDFHHQKLRKKSINIEINQQKITLEPQVLDRYRGSNISIFAFNDFIAQASDICYETLKIDNSEIDIQCNNKFFDIYIHDQDGVIQAGNIVSRQ
jgi:phosphatidylserine/phosphatidylglycerophosphate/cardiolipin synthase-like enzyme